MDKVIEMLNQMNVNINKRFDQIDGRLDQMDGRLDQMDGRFDHVDSRLSALESQVQENTSILKSLEHAAEVSKAEHDQMNHTIAIMQGDIAEIKHELSFVEIVTSKNLNDIAKLKAIK